MGTPPRSQCNTSPEYAPCYGAVQAVARKGSRVEGGSDPDKGGVPAAIRP